MATVCETRASLGKQMFENTALGDARLTARLVRSFDRMCLHPGGTLPQKMDVQAQKGRVARQQAEFIVRGGSVLVLPPTKRSGIHGDEPLALYVVLTTESGGSSKSSIKGKRPAAKSKTCNSPRPPVWNRRLH